MKRWITFACACCALPFLIGGAYQPNPGVPYAGAGQNLDMGSYDLVTTSGDIEATSGDISAKDAGGLYSYSAGSDKWCKIFNDDTNSWVTTSAGMLICGNTSFRTKVQGIGASLDCNNIFTMQTAADASIFLRLGGEFRIEDRDAANALRVMIDSATGNYTSALGDLTLSAGNLSVGGDITVTGTVDGIDVATDVGTNTTHRGLSNNPHTVTAAQAAAIATAYFDAKGDIISASGDNTPALLAVGNDHEILAALASETTGHKWITVPKRATMWHDEATVTNGNALTHTSATDQRYQTISNQDVAADADVFTNGCFLVAGTYNFGVLGATSADRGKIDWSLDGGAAFETGQDWYSAGLTWNVVKTVGGVAVATTGWHTLTGTVNGKNGASSGFTISPTKYWFSQAAD